MFEWIQGLASWRRSQAEWSQSRLRRLRWLTLGGAAGLGIVVGSVHSAPPLVFWPVAASALVAAVAAVRAIEAWLSKRWPPDGVND